MKYYLDSSSLMTGIKKISELSQKHELQTSILSIIERVSCAGKDDVSYGRAKSVIRTLCESQVKVDYSMPDFYLHKGFDYLEKNGYVIVEERVKDFGKILGCLTQSPDRAKFLDSEKSIDLKYPLEYFDIYDSSFGPKDHARTKEQIDIVKEAFEQAQKGVYNSIVPPEIIQQGFKKFSEWFAEENGVLNNSLTIWSLAQRTGSSLGISVTEELLKEIYESYNGLIDIFVSAYSIASIKNLGTQNMPGRNDPIDLAHLLYLRDGMMLVTEDKKMRSTAEAANVNVFSIYDL